VGGRRVARRAAEGLRNAVTLLKFGREDKEVALEVCVFVFARSKLIRFRSSVKE
jgi:hypothetical protein